MPSRTQPPTAREGKYLIFSCSWLTSYAEVKTIGYETYVSDTYVETSEEYGVSMQYLPTSPTLVDRYVKQNKSALGKVAYVVYAGNHVGVFYNW